MPDYITLPQSRIPVTARPDVLVVGGGSAGVAAAVAAARNGADTLLIERFSYTGGLATGGMIVLLLTMDDGAGEPFELERVHPWLWFELGGVNVEKAIAQARGLWFRTVGHDRVLVPWGGEASARHKIDATDPTEVSHALIECRGLVMEEASRLKSSHPGFEDAYVSLIADQLGITESRRLQGRYVIARDDLNRPFDDTIARTGHWTKYDCTYSIPYRSLLPRTITNLLTAGRCISADHRAHHATKEIPPCIATGQAAGTAAALAITNKTAPANVDVPALQKRLRDQGAILT